MTFDTQQLYDTHKRKFCVGNTADPARIHSRISGKSANRHERKDKQEFQTVSEDDGYMYSNQLLTLHYFIVCFPVSGWL